VAANVGAALALGHQQQVVALEEANESQDSVGGRYLGRTREGGHKAAYLQVVELVGILLDAQPVVGQPIYGQEAEPSLPIVAAHQIEAL